MRVLVAGASGFLGLAAVRSLAQAGHEVVGLARSNDKGELVAAAGGTPALGDILAIPSLIEAARGCQALVHLAAAATTVSRAVGQSVASKVRVDGAYNLVAAARKVGAGKLVIGSGTWLHGDHREPITEASSVRPTGNAMFNWQAERAALEANKPGVLEVCVVRPAMVYGDGGWFREMVEEIRAGTYRVPGEGANHWSFVHVDDCGQAFAAVLERGTAGQVYLAADDEPLALRSFVNAVAELDRARRPASMTAQEAVAIHGEATARHLMANQEVANAKLKALGWAPRYRTARAGLPPVLHALAGRLA